MKSSVLIVEDEARIRDIVRDYFAAHGLDCDLARDGEEALDLLRDHDYDAILLDIFCPIWMASKSVPPCAGTARCRSCSSLPWAARRICSGAMRWAVMTMSPSPFPWRCCWQKPRR